MDNTTQRTIFQRLSVAIIDNLERFYYRFGYTIALHPWRFILICLAVVAVSSLGILRFRQEKHPMKLWIPPDSDFARDTEWLMSNFREGVRAEAVLVTAPDVLQPRIMQQLAEIHKSITAAKVEGISWEDVCFRIPIISFNLKRRRKAILNGDINGIDFDSGSEFDPSSFMGDFLYCSIVNNLATGCLEHSLIELWKYNDNMIQNLTKEDILNALNLTKISPVFGHRTNYIHLLGDVKKDDDGKVVGASALLMLFFVHVDFASVNMDEAGNNVGTADWATTPVLLWEEEFLKTMRNISKQVEGMEIFYEAGRSFGDISASAVFQEIDKLAMGIALMFTFVQLVVSKFNMVEFRFILGSIGLFCIGMAFIVSVGLCSLAGIPYGPVHTALPFLLMGIGVDDMFVIMTTWNNLPDNRRLTLPQRFGTTMQHAGTSITITTLTDVAAFLVGALTILPSLHSFCLYAATGLIVTFIFQTTFFVGCFVLDERRVEAYRNSLVVCYKHKNYKANACSQVHISRTIFNKVFSKLILTTPGKVLVIMTAVASTAISINGAIQLRQKFDPMWFLPESTYLYKFIQARSKYFPDVGQDAGVFFGKLNYSAELSTLHTFISQFKEEETIIKETDDWLTPFRSYVKKNYRRDIANETISDHDFSYYISRFLFTPKGAKYQKNFRFDGKLQCGKAAPPVTISSFDFKFKLFNDPKEYLPAKKKVKSLIQETNITTGDRFATVWGKVFANWVTDEVIDKELLQNLILACACVMLVTSVLIVNLLTSFLIFMCVLLTLVAVAGMMYYWGMTVDIVSCIGMQLAAGLCVDYGAHIGHMFLTQKGTCSVRILNTVSDIGPAILSGGISTLLALSVLANSESYIFTAFFKIFLLVVVFGLFHGLILLPVVLSIIGPEPYAITRTTSKHEETNYNMCVVEPPKDENIDDLS